MGILAGPALGLEAPAMVFSSPSAKASRESGSVAGSATAWAMRRLTDAILRKRPVLAMASAQARLRVEKPTAVVRSLTRTWSADVSRSRR